MSELLAHSFCPDCLTTGEFRHCQKSERPETSEALAAHRDELLQLVSRYDMAHPRAYGSAVTGKEDKESDLDLLVDAMRSTTLFIDTAP